ncbi:MAG TPA: carboxypeptidase regulatory-like domain-containing protein [Acidobacteriota bacterium]|jgi:hypothetical protein|nr:carboxypeptidase regulatory-like domain-containing protein [Acidobacteriota bacterium]
MQLFQRFTWQSIVLTLALFLPLSAASAVSAEAPGTLRGRVIDQKGGVVVAAQVALVDAAGVEKVTATNGEGVYSFTALSAGVYTLRVNARGFATYENLAQIPPDNKEPVIIDVKLTIATEKQEVTVTSEKAALSVDAENNGGALILKGKDLDALPDDPDDLADALQALAGPSAGPNGGQFYIDGFSGGSLPPKSSIREIRINQNPFSSEFDRLGFGRIEILTKPGSDKFRGEANFNFNDESLNSRNPFAPTRAPFQARRYGGNYGGPLGKNKASFFVDFERREFDENAVISAQILDSNLNPTRFSQTVITPQRHTSFSPRIDYQLNDNNTLVTRYHYSHNNQINEGVGEFSLFSRAYNGSSTEHEINFRETAILSPRLINETRFEFERRENNRVGDNSVPTIQVLQAFTGGGSQVGVSSTVTDQWELHNSTSWVLKNHSLKIGGRLRGMAIDDISRSNFGGAFTFGGGFGPQLDANNQVVLDSSGNAVLVPITSLERYRRTLLFQKIGMTPQQIRALGGGATQFSIVGGDPTATVSQIDFGGYIQDDWRLRPDFMLSLGLRYELQTNMSDKTNFGPRIAFAWSPGMRPGFRPKMVFRGGFGMFYERFSGSLTLDADRFNGVKQEQFIVSNPDFFPNVPSVDVLTASARPQTLHRISPDIRAPYMMQSAVSVERQLPKNFTLTASYVNMRMLHGLRSRNINAPLPGTGVRPLGDIGNVYEYESTALTKQNQLIIGVNSRFSQNLTLFSNYTFGQANSDADGVGSFPASQYDLSTEYGRAGYDIRHRFMLGGSITAPWGVRLNPFIIASSGRPFNITTGRDQNGDTVFTDRPAFATDLNKPGVIVTPYGAFDPNPGLGGRIIPRNFGEGPGFFVVNLRISKVFGFGPSPEDASSKSQAGGPPSGVWAGGAPSSGHGPSGGGPRGGGGSGISHGGGGGDRVVMFGGGGGMTDKRYNLTFSVQASNLLNHTNFGPVIGNLSSPLFGLSNTITSGFGFRGPGGGGFSMAGNRRVELQLRFSF